MRDYRVKIYHSPAYRKNPGGMKKVYEFTES